jgi:hypothetical protein
MMRAYEKMEKLGLQPGKWVLVRVGFEPAFEMYSRRWQARSMADRPAHHGGIGASSA